MYTLRAGHVKGFAIKRLQPLNSTELFSIKPYAGIIVTFPIELWELGIRKSRNAEGLDRATGVTNKLPFISDTEVLKLLLTSKRHDKLRY